MHPRHERLRRRSSNYRKRFRGGIAGLAFVGALAALACSSEEKKAGLVVALQTDMSIPKDVDAVEIEVSVFGKVKHSEKYAIGEKGVHIPATLTLLPPDDERAPVTIRVISYQNNVARTLRRVVTTVPNEREALLRMPIEWLCWNQVVSGKEGPVSTCDEGSSCVAGSCVSDEVDSSSLPAFAASFVFGGASSDAEGACFDTMPCFARRSTVTDEALDVGTCTLEVTELDGSLGAGGASMTVDPAKLNFGFVPADGRGICSSDGDCIVPLDHDDTSGWRLDGTTVHFPEGVCSHLEKSAADTLVASTLCDQKRAATPACGKWTGVSGSKITIDLGELPPEPGTGGSGGSTPSGGATGSGGAADSGGTSGSGGTGPQAMTNSPNRCATAQPLSGSTTYDTSGSTFNRTSYSGTGACMWSGLEGLETTYAVEVPPGTGIVSSLSGPNDVLIASKTCSDVSDCYIARSNLSIAQLRYFNDSTSLETLYLTVDSTEGGGHQGTLSLAALTPVCGDGQVTYYDNYSEGCDDGGQVDGDGCSAACVVEPGYVCRVPGEPCELIVCGDGIVDAPETCDDGNQTDEDGCDSDCHLTIGWFCENEPSECRLVPTGSIASNPVYIDGSITEPMAGKYGPDGPGSAAGQVAYFYGNMAETDTIRVRIVPTFGGVLYTYNKAACPETDCDSDGTLDAVGLAANQTTDVFLSGAPYAPQFVVVILADTPTTGDIVISAAPAECGDGYVDPELGEQCDDTELVPGDGCSVYCQIEPGWTCSDEPSNCELL